jgi:hypothetical protein
VVEKREGERGGRSLLLIIEEDAAKIENPLHHWVLNFAALTQQGLSLR